MCGRGMSEEEACGEGHVAVNVASDDVGGVCHVFGLGELGVMASRGSRM